MTWPFGELRPFGYGAIIADPPWRYQNYSRKGEHKGAAAQYTCMTIDELTDLPVGHLAKPDCALFLWATAPLLPEALRVMAAWGFQFKSAGAWAKQSSTGKKWAFGTGYCFRAATEFYLLGTIGAPTIRSRSIRNLIVAPTRGHSRKPGNLHSDVEALYDGPYAELFGRAKRPGWDVWGNETEKFLEAAE